jgi:hypothetical protein
LSHVVLRGAISANCPKVRIDRISTGLAISGMIILPEAQND